MKYYLKSLFYPLSVLSLISGLALSMQSCAQPEVKSAVNSGASGEIARADVSQSVPLPQKTDQSLQDKSNPISIQILANNTEQPYYLINKDKDFQIHINIRTTEIPGTKVKLDFDIKDFWDKSVYKKENEVTVDSSGFIKNIYNLNRLERLGYYQIYVLVNQKDLIDPKKARKFTYSFGIVDPIIATSKLEPDSPYGIAMRGKVIDDTMIKTLQRVGIKWARNGILARWSDVEKEKGKFDYAANIDFIRRLNDHGISRLERLDGIAPWERKTVMQNNPERSSKKGGPKQKAQQDSREPLGNENITQENPNLVKKDKKKNKAKNPATLMLPISLDAWKKYVQKTINSLYPSAAYYEVWNEPDIPKQYWRDSMENYVKLLNAAYDAKKQANPEASILMAGFTGGFSNMEKPQKRQWFELVLSTGKYDVINFHSYGELALHEERYKDLSEIIRKYNLPNKPIWITETGSRVWRADKPRKKQSKKQSIENKNDDELTDDRLKIYSEKEQARNYIQNFLVANSYGVDKLFTHANLDVTHDEDYAVIRKNNTPRPWMLAQAALAKWIHNAKFVKTTQDKTLRRFVFQQDGKEITALFNQASAPERFLISTNGPVSFIDMMGNSASQVEKSNNNQYSVSISDYPMYVVGSVSSVRKIN